MSARPGHSSRDVECTCELDADMVVCFESAALWARQHDGWAPVPNRSRQRGTTLHVIGRHRPAVLSDVTATRGTRRGSFIRDGSPVNEELFSDLVPDYLVTWPEWDAYWAARSAS